MSTPDYRSIPDEHLEEAVAAAYDSDHGASSHFAQEQVQLAVAFLADLAGEGAAVEFAVGTGRVALPLSERVSPLHGVDFSQPMLDQLQKKAGADRVQVTLGDMTSTRLCSNASLVYLVFNTIGNLRTQALQVACFRNAAAHLAPGGRFVIETGVPKLHQLPAGETIRPFDVSASHLGFEEYVDKVNQISISHHYFIDGDRVRSGAHSFRYVWPSELDLMAQLAGMTLEDRWADWQRSPFTGDSPSHVSVWQKS